MPAYPLTLPDWTRPTSEAWWVENADRSGGPSVVGTEQIVASGSSRWRATQTFEVYREKIVPIRGLLTGLRGRSGTYLTGPYDMLGTPLAVGTPADQGLYDTGLVDPMTRGFPSGTDVVGTMTASAALRAYQVSFTLQANRMPFVGNWIGLRRRMHNLIAVAKNGDGSWTCEVEPLLREPLPSGEPVVFNRPVCLMRLNTALSADALRVMGGSHVTNV